jgi:Fe-S-cluster-containing dehydrogenase component
MCVTVCPSGALAFGPREEILALRRERTSDVFIFGPQRVKTKVQLMVPSGTADVEMDVAAFMHQSGRKTNAEPAWLTAVPSPYVGNRGANDGWGVDE